MSVLLLAFYLQTNKFMFDQLKLLYCEQSINNKFRYFGILAWLPKENALGLFYRKKQIYLIVDIWSF